jgi:hypothetical protein
VANQPKPPLKPAEATPQTSQDWLEATSFPYFFNHFNFTNFNLFIFN